MPLKYYNGYPRRYLLQRTKAQAFCLLHLLFLVPSSAAALFGVQATLLALEWTTVSLTLVATVGFAWFLRNAVKELREVHHARIVPYFRRGVGKGGAFGSGHALAQHCQLLDNTASKLKLEPLSLFGFADDASAEELQWHNASTALKTVRGLLSHLKVASDLGPETCLVIADLEKLEAELEFAEARDVSFCLILRQGFDRWICPVEMDRRQGSFW
jgi:hypothetical protein